MGQRLDGVRHSSTRSEPGSGLETELEVFSTGTTVACLPDRPPTGPEHPAAAERDDAPSLGDRLRHGGEVVLEGLEHARGFHARPGHRPGTPPLTIGTASARAGGDSDIVRPVLVSPTLACELATSGTLFADPIPHLAIARGDDDVRRFLVWDGLLDSGGRQRGVTFHLLASPSMVVTVLELVPRRRLRRHRDQFIADGVAAVETIARRLEQAARHS
jgi:hypothetical protein